MDFEIVQQAYLAKLDETYGKLREMIAQPDMLNPDWPPYRKLSEEFESLTDDIFRLKAAKSSAEDLINKVGRYG